MTTKTMTRTTIGSLSPLLVIGALAAVAPEVALSEPIPEKGTTRYVTHFVFRPLGTVETPGIGKVTALEASGPTENMDGQTMLHGMQANCMAVNIESGDKKYIDGACALTDNDGDVVFSTFDTRELDKSQPEMDCGTHIITGGTGKYTGITGREPFKCISMPTPEGVPEGAFAMDIPHTTTWEINVARAGK
jgi:hypothetical protein